MCSSYLIKHPDGLLGLSILVSTKIWVYSGGLFAFAYSNSLLWQWYLKKCFEHQHQTKIFILSHVGSPVSLCCQKTQKLRKTLYEFVLPFLQTEEWEFIFEPGRQLISLSSKQNLFLGEPREILFHDMVFNGPSTNTRK